MNATEASLATPAEVQTGPRETGTAVNGDELGGDGLFVSDLSVALRDATDAPPVRRATPPDVETCEKATATQRDELGGARLFASDVGRALSDVRLAFLLTDEAYERVVAQVFGIRRDQQTFLVKLILTGALATVLEGLAPRPSWILPSGGDTAMGVAVLNTALRGIAGAPSQAIPAAGTLIGCAVLAHALRSAVARSARDVHALAQTAEGRYGHRSARHSLAAAITRPQRN